MKKPRGRGGTILRVVTQCLSRWSRSEPDQKVQRHGVENSGSECTLESLFRRKGGLFYWSAQSSRYYDNTLAVISHPIKE